MELERAPRVKNRAPAAIQVSPNQPLYFAGRPLTSGQITAEQLLREAQERQEPSFKAPRQRVQDQEELNEFQGRKRTEFEGRVRYSRDSIRGTSAGRDRARALIVRLDQICAMGGKPE